MSSPLSQHPPPQIRVDSHTHVLPQRLGAKIRRFFVDHGFAKDHSCCAPSSSALTPDDKPAAFAYPTAPEAVVAMLVQELADNRQWEDQAELPTLWTLPYAHKGGMAQKLNRDVLELAADISGGGKVRIVPGLTCHPNDENPVEILSEAVKGGAKVVKLHVSVGGFSVLDERLRHFFGLCEALRLPVVVHSGTEISGLTEDSDLFDIGQLCSHYPELPLILAHAGHPVTAIALDLTRKHPNLYLDTTPIMTTLVDLPPSLPASTHDTSDAYHLLYLAHTGRILYGSDAPTTAITRSEAAWAVRHWIRKCVSEVMGGLTIEDVGHEMDRVAGEVEQWVFGKAALRLEAGVKTMDAVFAEWDAKKDLAPSRTAKL